MFARTKFTCFSLLFSFSHSAGSKLAKQPKPPLEALLRVVELFELLVHVVLARDQARFAGAGEHRPGEAVHGERANFTRFVLGWLARLYRRQMLQVNGEYSLESSRRDLHSFAPFWNRSLISKFSLRIDELFAVFFQISQISPKFY